MDMKKITCNMIIMVCLYGTSAAATVDIQEVSSAAEIADYNNEQAIILKGDASYGKDSITGPACVVIKRKQLKKVRKGDIVVAHEINSLWRGGLESAAGIIIEKGDAHSYALELGKKLGIPVIVGATGATKNIVDGQTITCDPVTCNVYHVAYSDAQRARFEVVHVSQKDKQHLLDDKLMKTKNNAYVDALNVVNRKDNTIVIVEKNAHVMQLEGNVHRGVVHNTSGYSIERARNLYRMHFNNFKKSFLKDKSRFETTKGWLGIKAVEAGARNWEGYDDLAVDCICLAEPFIERSKRHISERLEKVGQSDECMECIDSLINECRKNPKNLNYAARRAYIQKVERTKLPNHIKKEDLIEHPREYKKIQDELDEDQQEDDTVIGSFIQYLIKNNLL